MRLLVAYLGTQIDLLFFILCFYRSGSQRKEPRRGLMEKMNGNQGVTFPQFLSPRIIYFVHPEGPHFLFWLLRTSCKEENQPLDGSVVSLNIYPSASSEKDQSSSWGWSNSVFLLYWVEQLKGKKEEKNQEKKKTKERKSVSERRARAWTRLSKSADFCVWNQKSKV